MKIFLICSAPLILGVATGAVCQEREMSLMYGTSNVARGYDYSDYFPAAAHHAEAECEADCHVPWSQYRHGALWENYCLERRSHATALNHGRLGHRGPCAAKCYTPVQPRRVAQSAMHYGRHSKRRLRLQRERIICLDLFCELLGWNPCWNHAGCRDHGGHCCEAGYGAQVPDPVAETNPIGGPVTETESSREDSLLRKPDHAMPDAASAGDLELTRPAAADDEAETSVPSTAPAIESPRQQSPGAPDDPPPTPPRNVLPQIDDSSRNETTPSGGTTPVAERLRDFINTD